MNELIRNHFPALKDFIGKYDCAEIDKYYDEANFGNAYLTVELNKLVFRFVKDRSQYFVNVKLLDEVNWHLLNNIFEFLNITFPQGAGIEKIVSLLGNNLSAVDTVFSNKEEFNKFIKFEKEKMLSRWGKFVDSK